MVSGGGPVIAGAMDIVRQLAETLNMVVATTVSGQGVIAETHPNALGVVGSNGGVPATRAVMDRADLVLFVGCRAGSVTTERWCSPGKSVPVIHIDSDPMVLGANYRTEIAICADAYLGLSALLGAIRGKKQTTDFGGTDIVRAAWSQKLEAFLALAGSVQRPITPERVIHSLSNCLDDDAVVVAEIKSNRQSFLPGIQGFVEKFIGFLCGGKSGILADSPGADSIHGRARPACKGRFAWHTI